uniref:MFS transporter n=1 Tax=candidate division WOR-3 bacterium TaxID=2052148 RepID=A0A7C2K4D6_UNCW3
MAVKILATILFYFGYGSYYILLRPRFVDLGATYFQILLIDSLPAFVALTSVLWGRLADVISRRLFLLLSSLGGIFVVLLGFSNRIGTLLFLLLFLSIFASIAVPIINSMFSFSEDAERSFAIYLFAEAIGWTLSGTIMGYFSNNVNLFKLGYMVSGLAWALGVIIFYQVFTGGLAQSSPSSSIFKVHLNKNLVFLAIGTFFLEFGIVTSYGILSVKLYDVLGRSKFLYGIVWASVPAFLSALVSKFYGDVVKKLTPWKSLVLLSSVYFVNIVVLTFSKGYLMAFFWVLPLWNFMYIALYSAVTKLSLESERATAFGFLNSTLNLAVFLSASSGILADKYGRMLSISLGLVSILFSLFIFVKLLGGVMGDVKILTEQ